jgi:hypothetical protein
MEQVEGCGPGNGQTVVKSSLKAGGLRKTKSRGRKRGAGG